MLHLADLLQGFPGDLAQQIQQALNSPAMCSPNLPCLAAPPLLEQSELPLLESFTNFLRFSVPLLYLLLLKSARLLNNLQGKERCPTCLT